MAKDTLVLFLSDNGGCAEEIGPEGRAQHFPRRTRDGRPSGSATARHPPGTRGHLRELRPRMGARLEHALPPLQELRPRGRDRDAVHRPLARRDPRGDDQSGVGHVVDLLPTLLAAAGVPRVRWRGRTSSTATADEPRTLFWEHEGNRAVRRGDFKLVAVHGGPWELYNIAEDRTELRDLAAYRPEPRARADVALRRLDLAERCQPWTQSQTPIGGRR